VTITGTVHVACPACDRGHDVRLVQSINAASDPASKQRLLAGELNVLACECGKRTQVAATVLFHDPGRHLYVRVVPEGGEVEMAAAAAQFAAAATNGTQRLVPSLNALVEKVKIFDAGLEDWAIEMMKVLLLSRVDNLGAARREQVPTLDRVLLFDGATDDALRWVLFDAAGRAPESAASRLEDYRRIAARDASRPRETEYRIDRAWAVGAVQAMIAAAN
jgi:hypothetical protein